LKNELSYIKGQEMGRQRDHEEIVNNGTGQYKTRPPVAYSAHNYWEERLSQHFDLTGAGYATLGPRFNATLYKARLEALEKGLAFIGRTLKGSSVLEAGCGTGFYTGYCAQQGVSSYVGLDITSISVSTLQKRYPNFSFIQSDISADKIPDLGSGFDIVLAADVLFHIVQDVAFENALQNLISRLRPGGLLIISDVFPANSYELAYYIRIRSLNDYSHLFEKYQARISHIEPIFAILQPPPLMPHMNWLWQGYAWLWRYGWRLARWDMIDILLPPVLARLDKYLFLPKWGRHAPNNKWLFAIKDDVA
jgi:SAM-dependent methyltransferase